jgi:hypothetical protein
VAGLIARVADYLGLARDDSADRDFLNDAADMGAERVERYAIYRDYYDGRHKGQLLERARIVLQASGLPFAENFTETVVNAHASRLVLDAFNVVDEQTSEEWLNDWRSRSDLAAVAQTIHKTTLRDGDGILIGEWDPVTGQPRMCWNDPATVKPVYGATGHLEYASKVWTTTQTGPSNPTGMEVRRLNVYWPDRIEKWFTIGESEDWQRWVDGYEVDPQTGLPILDEHTGEQIAAWPTPWLLGTDPIGVDVVHFRNDPLGEDYGRSVEQHVIPQQDQLNKQVLDLFYVMDSQGWKQRWASGIDDTPGRLRVAIGEWVTSSNDMAKFGEFSAEDPTKLVETIEGTLRRLAARSRTPLHELLTSTAPSGEERKQAESGIVAATEERHVDFRTPWVRVARLVNRMALAFGDGAVPIPDDAVIEPIWKMAETRSDLEDAQVANIHHGLGVSGATLLRKLGYDPDEEAELRASENQEAVTQAKAMADATRDPNMPPPGGRQ